MNETTTGAFGASRDARKSAETRRTCAYIMSLIVSLREKEKSSDENYEVVEGATLGADLRPLDLSHPTYE